MFKKAIPLVLMSGLVLTACANNSTVPKNNETPMEKVEDRTRDLTPDVKNGQTGPNMDGLENDGDLNGVDNGVINDNNGVRNGVINDTNKDTDKDMMEDSNTPREEIIEDDLDRKDKDLNDR